MFRSFLYISATMLFAFCGNHSEIILSKYQNGTTHERILLDQQFRIGDTMGRYQVFYNNSNLAVEGHIEHNKQQGTWVEFHPDGTIKRKAQFNLGKLNGEVFWSDQNGNWSKVNYKNGVKEGPYTRFEKWITEDSDTLYYYTCGQYRNNLAQGLWQRKDIKGTILAENTLVDCKITGYFSNRYNNGAIKFRGKLNIDSAGTNKFDYFDKNGNKSKMDSYEISLVEP